MRYLESFAKGFCEAVGAILAFLIFLVILYEAGIFG